MAKSKEYEMMIKIAGRADASLGNSIKNATDQISGLQNTLKKVGAAAAGVFAFNTVKNAVSDAVQVYSDYESSLKNTFAISKANEAEQQQLADAARTAGKATSFTAAESADALGYMALAGWDVKTSTEALMPVLKLAEATGEDLATTSDQVTDSMSAMGLDIDDLNGYLNVLVATNNNANTSAAELMDAFTGAGGAARAAGLNYQDTAIALGILGNNGIKGAEAGTALNSMLVRMTTKSTALDTMKSLGVSVYDTSGNMRNLQDILIDLNKAMDGMSDSEKNANMAAIAGTNYYSQFQYLLEGVQNSADGTASSWDTLAASIEESGGSLDAFYEEKTNTIAAALARVEAASSDAKMSFIEAFGPYIANIIDFLATKVFPKISDAAGAVSNGIAGFIDTMKSAAGWCEEHQTVLTALAIVLGTIAIAILAFNAANILSAVSVGVVSAAQSAYIVLLYAGEAATKAFTTALTFLTSPITWIIAIIGAVIAIGYLLWKNWDDLSAKANSLAAAITEKFPWMADIVNGAVTIIGGIAEGLKNIFGGIVTFVTGVFSGNWSKAWQGVIQIFGGIWKTLSSVAKAPLNAMISLVNTAISGINKLKVNIPDWVPGLGGKTFGFNIPKIPLLASGGIATAPTLAEIGEGSEPEAVLPLSKLAEMLKDFDNDDNDSDNQDTVHDRQIIFSPQITINGNADKSEVEKSVEEAYEQFKVFIQRLIRENKRLKFT